MSKYDDRRKARLNGVPVSSRMHESPPKWCFQILNPDGPQLSVPQVEAEIETRCNELRAYDRMLADWAEALIQNEQIDAARSLTRKHEKRGERRHGKGERPRFKSSTEARSAQLTEAAILSAFGC